MTPEQQEELRAQVRENPACADAYAGRDLDALATIMSAGRTRFKPTIIGDGTIIESFMEVYPVNGLDLANSFLDWFRGEPMFRHVVRLMDRGELRLDKPSTIGMLMQIAAGGHLPQAVATSLISTAKEPAPYDRLEIEAALYNPDGTMK